MLSHSGKTSDEPNDPDYCPNLYMRYNDDCTVGSWEKRGRYLRRKRRSMTKECSKIEKCRLIEEKETSAAEALLVLSSHEPPFMQPQLDQSLDDGHVDGEFLL